MWLLCLLALSNLRVMPLYYMYEYMDDSHLHVCMYDLRIILACVITNDTNEINKIRYFQCDPLKERQYYEIKKLTKCSKL